jgi:SAM-dependent methyltransferase
MEIYDAYTARHYNAFRPPLHGSILRQCLGQDSFSKVLDIGCGAGHSTVALAEFCQKAVGFDVSQSMLQQALQHPKIAYTAQMDGNTKFDMISFFGSINYIGSEELTSILKRLVKSGQVICCDFSVVLDTVYEQCIQEPFHTHYEPKKNLDAFPLTISLEPLSEGTDSQTFDASIKQTAHLLLADSIFLQKAQSYFSTPDPFDAILDKLEEIHQASFISLRANRYWKRYKLL